MPLALHPSSLQVGPRRDGMGVHHLQEQYLLIQGTGVRQLPHSSASHPPASWSTSQDRWQQLATFAGQAATLRLLQSIGSETEGSREVVRLAMWRSQKGGLSISHSDRCLPGPGTSGLCSDMGLAPGSPVLAAVTKGGVMMAGVRPGTPPCSLTK